MSLEFVGLLGMLTQMTVRNYVMSKSYGQDYTKMFCFMRIVWRFIGSSAGCVAFIMAIERYFALAKPFFYCRHFTKGLIKRLLFIFWTFCAVLTLAPVFGIGQFYDEIMYAKKCKRYRDAEKPLDVAYAFANFFAGK